MHRRIALFFALVALALAAGKTYTITTYTTVTLGKTELKAGSYKLRMLDGNSVEIDGKPNSKTAVRVETEKNKFGDTSLRMSTEGGKERVTEIRLGGTNTKLVIGDGTATN
jgi:hypothetical protein